MIKRFPKFAALSLFILLWSGHSSVQALETFSPLAKESDCSQWSKSEDYYPAAYTFVCESGYMRGESLGHFGSLNKVSRAAGAVIANRITLGFTAYENKSSSGRFYRDALRAFFTDTPADETWNEWILKAMYHAQEEGVMKGDGSKTPTTFRPYDGMTGAEFLKVVYESAKRGDALNEDFKKGFVYDGQGWYEGLVALFEEAGVIQGYTFGENPSIDFRFHYLAGEDNESTYQNYRVYLNTPLIRQDAAALINEMLLADFIYPISSEDTFAPSSKRIAPGIFEIQYGPDSRQIADLHYEGPDAPLVMLVHGGEEGEGEKANMESRWEMYKDLGFNVLVPEYRYGRNSVTEDPLPSHDVWCALSTAVDLAPEEDWEFPYLIVHGYSYGGYVSSYMTYKENNEWDEGCASQTNYSIEGFIGESTNYGTPGGKAGTDTYDDTLSPRDGAINYVDSNDPPALLFHGTEDPKFNPQRMFDFEDVLDRIGLSVKSILVQGRGHGIGLPSNSSLQSEIEDFILDLEP